jgi:LuxR family maltose regulon positive regulatory protein
MRVYLDEGDLLEQLLLEIEASEELASMDYLGEIIKSFRSGPLETTQRRDQIPQGLVEPLSERELEVLAYLDTHLTSNEIAETLNIAVSTVRSHIKNIYSKLNVHNRNDAVVRAQELDLL